MFVMNEDDDDVDDEIELKKKEVLRFKKVLFSFHFILLEQICF